MALLRFCSASSDTSNKPFSPETYGTRRKTSFTSFQSTFHKISSRVCFGKIICSVSSQTVTSKPFSPESYALSLHKLSKHHSTRFAQVALLRKWKSICFVSSGKSLKSLTNGFPRPSFQFKWESEMLRTKKSRTFYSAITGKRLSLFWRERDSLLSFALNWKLMAVQCRKTLLRRITVPPITCAYLKSKLVTTERNWPQTTRWSLLRKARSMRGGRLFRPRKMRSW